MEKLTRSDRKQIEALLAKRKRGKHEMSAQDSIPFQRMFPDGICRTNDGAYSKTIRFSDLNYQLSTNEDKSAIFDGWCEFLNYFDSSIKFQLSFINRTANTDSTEQSIGIPLQGDEFDSIRTEYTEMLQNQRSKGNTRLSKSKYLTFSIEAESLKSAKLRLERIETDILSSFKRLGVAAEPLNGFERLETLHGIFHINEPQPFRFSWDWLAPSGLSVKDFIAPSSFEFRNGKYFGMGGELGAASFLQILAPELNDRMLADFLDMESSLVVTMHVQSVDQVAAIKMIKRKITDLDKSKIEEQKKALRSGYDMEILPSDLATYGNEAKKLLEDLQSRNERMFLLTFLVLNFGSTKSQLDNNVFQASSIAQKYNCLLTRLDFQQEEGLMSSLPLGMNQIEIQCGLTTSSTAIFIPFTTQELFQNGKEALYCGLNALSNNLIMVDRKLLKNPNGLILGTPGSGKSFSAKREIANVFLVTDDDIIICDPESEYGTLVERLNGQVIKISPTSSDFVNPMDLNLNYSDDENPLSLMSDFILSLCELIVGGKEGLKPVEKTIIDRCVRSIYRHYLNDPIPENMPILGDLYDELRRQDEKEAQYIATALEIYVSGSLNVFNHRTNINIENRVVSFDIKELGKQLKKIGMLIVQDAVWNRVTVNREEHKSTRYYIDEMHLLLKEEQTAAYTVEIWKRFRKWGGIPTGLTQNVKDLLSSREVENIFENSDYICMLNQASGDRQILAKQLNISPYQLSYVTHSGEGEGLLFYGKARALGYAKPRNALNAHCKGALKRGSLTAGGMQELTFIPEGDVYRLITQSKLPSAEKFEVWVFDEVLPCIRKNGGYMTKPLLDQVIENPSLIIEFARRLVEEQQQNQRLREELETARPKAEYYDAFIDPEDCTNFRATAKELKVPERKFISFLIGKNYVYRAPSGNLMPYAGPASDGLFIVKDYICSNGHKGQQTLITPKGKSLFLCLAAEIH